MPVISIFLVLILSGTVLFTSRDNKKLVKEKEELMLKNDSLHMQQLRTRKEMMFLQARLDSIIKKKN